MEDQKPATPASPAGAPLIHAALCAVMHEVGAVGKLGTNQDQKYPFRRIADVYKACQQVFAKHGVHMVPHAVKNLQVESITSGKGTKGYHMVAIIEERFYAVDGSFVTAEAIGESSDWSDKAGNKVMTFGAKNVLVSTLCLPDEDPDADGDNNSPEAVDAFEPLWTALEAIGVKEPSAMKTWCEDKLARALPNAESLTLADLPKLMAEAKRPVEPTRHKASKEEALRLMAALEASGVVAHDPKLSKKENSEQAKRLCLNWVNGMRPGVPVVGGLLELYADEIIPLTSKAKAGDKPTPEPLPDFMEGPPFGATEDKD